MPLTRTLKSADLLSAEVGNMGVVSSPRSPTAENAGRQLRDSSCFEKDSGSLRINVLCTAVDDRCSEDVEVTKKYLDEFDAAEAGEVGLLGSKSPGYKSPRPSQAGRWITDLRTALRDFLLHAGMLLTVCGWLCLLALLVVALASRGINHSNVDDDGASRYCNNIVSLSHSGRKLSGPRSLLAAGLSSVVAKLGEDTVDKYARPKGYLRKSLLSASRVQMETKQHDMEDLQQYYEEQIKSLNDDIKAQKEVYEQRLHAQESVLDDVLGEDKAADGGDSDNETFLPKMALSGATGNTHSNESSRSDRSAFVSSSPSLRHE